MALHCRSFLTDPRSPHGRTWFVTTAPVWSSVLSALRGQSLSKMLSPESADVGPGNSTSSTRRSFRRWLAEAKQPKLPAPPWRCPSQTLHSHTYSLRIRCYFLTRPTDHKYVSASVRPYCALQAWRITASVARGRLRIGKKPHAEFLCMHRATFKSACAVLARLGLIGTACLPGMLLPDQ